VGVVKLDRRQSEARSGDSSKRGKPLACRMMPPASGCAVSLSP